MEAKFKIGETLIITSDPGESKRGKEVVVVDTFHFIRKSKVSDLAVGLWKYKVKDETRIMGWISEYHLESLIKTKNKEEMNIMTRKECLDKIQEAVDNLDTLLAVIKLPSKTTIRWDCEVYADEADKITNALNALHTNYGNETREEFCVGLDNE